MALRKLPAPKPPKQKASGNNTGAYFMPTATRTNSSSNYLEKAFTVQQHVPSLKHKDESVSVDKLKFQYQGNGPGPGSSSQKSLFAALEQSEMNSPAYQHSDTQIPSYQSPNLIPRRPQNKKKIVIKRPGSDSTGMSGKETASEVSSKMDITHVNTAENYIAEIKSLLSVESYKLFSKALMEYKKQEDLLKVIAVLADLFTNEQRNYHLFAKFYRFVRPHHKKQFHQMCLDLTGLSTSYKPEDTVNKKRLREESGSNSSENNCSKKSKSSAEEACSTLLGKENTATNGIVQCDKTCDSSANCDTKKNTETHGDGGGSDTVVKDNHSGVDHHSDTASQHRQMKFPDIRAKSGYKCCLCKEEANAPFRSNCEHVCCMKCWRTVFEGDKLCPECKVRVRRRHLVRLFFRSGQDFDNEVSSDPKAVT